MSKTVIIACEVMREELLRVSHSPSVSIKFLSMGLHVSPDRLRSALSEELYAVQDATQIVLGFGLCGAATEGLSSPHATIIIPRVHDCIPLLLGHAEIDGGPHLEKGTFYLSGGWMEGERTLISEHRRATAKFGEKRALRILNTMFSPYEKIRFIRTDHPRVAAREEEAKGFAGLLNLVAESTQGDSGYLSRLINGPWVLPEFVCIPKGEVVTATVFLNGAQRFSQSWAGSTIKMPPVPGGPHSLSATAEPLRSTVSSPHSR